MSEYQCYEFVALDRPLTAKQMSELRGISTRAEISPTRFWNEYQWGDLKADPAKLMERYFDAHLYFANWGTHRLMLRIPKARVDLKVLKPYFVGRHAARLTSTGEYVLLDLGSDTEEPEYDEQSQGSLAALSPLRAELMRGDLRPAYLAWLLAVAAEASASHARRTGPPPDFREDKAVNPRGGGQPTPDATGGPDGFGYIFFDQADGCTFQFVDISASGTPVVSGDDTASAPIALSQPFSFYGSNFNSLVMASNGYVTTDLADTGPDLSNVCPLPAVPSTPVGTNGRRMYPFHDDLVLTGGASQGFAQFFAACPRVQDAPQACTVFQWNDV